MKNALHRSLLIDMEERTSCDDCYGLNHSFPKAQIGFLCQIITILIIITAAVVNLSLDNGDKTLWVTLLASCSGYLLPNPTLKRIKPKLSV